MNFIIRDWAGNHPFTDKLFKTFEDAWGFLLEFFHDNDMDADEWGQEYYVEETAV